MDAGTTVFIMCVAYPAETVSSVSWIRHLNQTVLGNSSQVTIYQEPITIGGLTFVQSVLEVCSLQVADAGEYHCYASDGFANDSVSFNLTVHPVEG